VVDLNIPVIADRSAANVSDFACGANQDDWHYAGVNWGRDCLEPEVADLRKVVEGDVCARANEEQQAKPSDEDKITIKRGIEVGHIFQLGTKYSEAMKATCLDNNGKAVVMPMGCYGIGVSRIVASAIEQNYDDRGILWPTSMAPFEVVITPIGYHKSERVKQVCDELYEKLTSLGIETLLDDRNERPGAMFSDADLIGIPHRLTVGEKSLDKNVIEYKARNGEQSQDIPQAGVIEVLDSLRSK
jgi:prolyl-tRNA synthetase